jgi:hypothetical protein
VLVARRFSPSLKPDYDLDAGLDGVQRPVRFCRARGSEVWTIQEVKEMSQEAPMMQL